MRSSGSAQLNRRKPAPASPKHSPPRQATPKCVVGPFQQVHRQAVRGDPQPVADRPHVGEDVERPGGLAWRSCRRSRPGRWRAARPCLRNSFMYSSRARRRAPGRRSRPAARTAGRTRRGVDQLADRRHHVGCADREADPPAAHAVRLAERVGRDHVVHHPRLGQDRVVPALPDHVAVRLVGEDHQVGLPHHVGDGRQVVLGGHAAGRVVRRVEEDGAGLRVGRQEPRDVARPGGGSRSRAAAARSPARAPRRWRFGTYVGKCGLKSSTPSPGSSKASAKYCSNGFAPEPTTMFSASTGMPNSSCNRTRGGRGGTRAGRGSGRSRCGWPRSRGCPPPWRAGVLGNGLSPISSSTTSLPSAFRAGRGPAR